MKNLKLLIGTLLVVVLGACNQAIPTAADMGNKTDVFTEVFSTEKLPKQRFTIDNSIDNILTGESGTKIRIDKNSFVDASGKPVKGEVTIELKEALKCIDMVLGNLTTTFEGQALETGGMIYLNAVAHEKSLSLAKGKTIKLAVPADSTLQGMSIFEGKKDSTGIHWLNPIAMVDAKGSNKIRTDIFEKTTNILYSVDGFATTGKIDAYPDTVNAEVSRIAWEGDGLKITQDSVLQIGKYTVRFHKNSSLQRYNQVFAFDKGKNTYAVDPRTSYIFSIQKLGWANIDRLMNDPRTQAVELVTEISNQSDFNFVYVTLLTEKMYLPGYQKKDGSFSFSHGDYEEQRLPLGASATVVATAYKNDRPYFAFQKITISEKQNVTIHLKETAKDKLKADLIANL